MIARIGLERAEALEADQAPRKYTREDLVVMRDDYRQKLNQFKKKGGCNEAKAVDPA